MRSVIIMQLYIRNGVICIITVAEAVAGLGLKFGHFLKRCFYALNGKIQFLRNVLKLPAA